MIYFDEQTRQFSPIFTKNAGTNFIRNVSNNSGRLGMTAGYYGNKIQRDKYEQQLIAQGKDPSVARKLAKDKYGGSVGAAVTGGIQSKLAVGAAKNLIKGVFR